MACCHGVSIKTITYRYMHYFTRHKGSMSVYIWRKCTVSDDKMSNDITNILQHCIITASS